MDVTQIASSSTTKIKFKKKQISNEDEENEKWIKKNVLKSHQKTRIPIKKSEINRTTAAIKFNTSTLSYNNFYDKNVERRN